MLTRSEIFPSRVLFASLKFNALFSITCGLLLMIFYQKLSLLLGHFSPGILIFVGLSLVCFGLRLAYIVLKGKVHELEAWSIVVGDWLWVLASAGLIWQGSAWFTHTGQWTLGVIALVVLGFAEGQMYGLLKHSRRTLSLEP